MQRFSNASGGGVGNNTISGGSTLRENTRTDSSFTSSSFNLNSRRPSQLAPYKLKCEKESLSCRLGPPDFYPQTPNCPEETLTREFLQSGYKETVDGIEEAKEIVLTQVGALTKPIILRCKEAIRKHLRSINESRAQKRKAGQSYGVPLSGQLVAKPLLFPELRSCGEDSRKKWIEALSQHHKGLRSLADHIPHGFRKKNLLDIIVRHNVPLLRATWFIKVTYLNQVRPNSGGISSGIPDKSQAVRTELWTRDVIEYLQGLLDDLYAKNGFYHSSSIMDQPSQNQSSVPSHPRTDQIQAVVDGSEPSWHFKWQYMISLLRWHFAGGLLSPSLIIEWALSQLQEKGSVETLELLLPIIVDLIDMVVLSQTYVRIIVDMAIHFLHDLYPGGVNTISSAKKHLAAALVEILRYLLLVVPDTFVALDCFPLPVILPPDIINSKALDMPNEMNTNSAIHEGADSGSEDAYCRYLSFRNIASCLQQRALNLAKIVNPSPQGHGVVKLLQALDKALLSGDIMGAYICLFEDVSNVALDESWIAEVSPCLRSSLKWVGVGSSSFISAVFFLLEWATCDFRDFRTFKPPNVKFTGKRDFSQIYIAVILLKLRLEQTSGASQLKMDKFSMSRVGGKNVYPSDGLPSGVSGESDSLFRGSPKLSSKTNISDILHSPGILHDIIVCWLDQHEADRGKGFKHLEVLVMELIRHGLFFPPAYLRQLIVSGIMDKTETTFDLERRGRHLRILKQLPGTYLLDILEESDIAEVSHMREAVHIFSNERKLVLNGIPGVHFANVKSGTKGSLHLNQEKNMHKSVLGRDDALTSLLGKRKNHCRSPKNFFSKQAKTKDQVAGLKLSIATILCLPHSCCSSIKAQRMELKGSNKRVSGTLDMKGDLVDGKSGCEECSRAKKQRINDERIPFSGILSNQSDDDDDTWWMRKETKSSESLKDEQPSKSTKSSSRSRQKSVRKTQSMAQLAAARIEGSQGTSTSHVCESKAACNHHILSGDAESFLSVDGIKMVQIASIGKAFKKLRWLEKRSISIWLLKSVKQLIEGNENTILMVPHPLSSINEGKNVVRWKLREDMLSSILYLLDTCSDLYLSLKFLIWLFPRVPSVNAAAHLGRTAMLPKNNDNQFLDVKEAFVIAALQRYENTLVAMDLLPELLNAAMHRSASMVASNGRASGSLAFNFAKNLLKRYGKLSSVAKWERNFRSTCDQRLLSELETGRSLDAELGYSLGVPAGVEDVDDFLRQKIGGRIPRASQNMKEIVQKYVDEAIYGKERKAYGLGGTVKFPAVEKPEDIRQIAQQIVLSLLDCMRQNRGVTQDWDPSLVAAAISAVVGNVGSSCSNFQNLSSNANSLVHIHQIVCIHMECLCLLKEALGERINRIFDIALATEASSSISNVFSHVKTQRGQFQLPSEIHDVNQSSPDAMSNFSKAMSGRSFKAPAAVSALVIEAVVHGLTSLERMISSFRLKEGLDFMQFIRSARSNANGLSRGSGNFRLEHGVEVYVHWFRLLVGNHRTVFDGLVADIIGESHSLALSRMQRILPLAVAFPLAYSIFAMVVWWRPFLHSNNIVAREDVQLYQCLSMAIGDVTRHHPFRNLCLRDSQALLDVMVSDIVESEFAAILEQHNQDKHFRLMTFVPLRARLFLNAIVDCKMPSFTVMQDDGSWVSGRGEPRPSESEGKYRDKLVHVLDTLQTAKFHWQWVELRLLLNEQALMEKIENHSMSLVDAIRSLSPNAENFSLPDDESGFTEIVLTRLLVRPDAASLYSEVFHLLGRSLEEKLLYSAKWLLSGTDVLYGRKTVRQRLVNVAQQSPLKGVSTKVQYWKSWGWSDVSAAGDEKKKWEASSLEEGEVVEDMHDSKKFGKPVFQNFDGDCFNNNQHYATDKPFLELLLPCIDRSSSESRSMFASEMIKQLSSIDQHINSLTRGSSKQTGAMPGVDGPVKGSTRKGMRGGSPGLSRRPTGSKDLSALSIPALRSSIWLRLQFLLRLLPIFYADREPSAKNSKHAVAYVLLHLLGSPVVYEDLDGSCFSTHRTSSRRDSELLGEGSIRPFDFSVESLFERILSVLHGLLSGARPGWLKGKFTSKLAVKSSRDFSPIDRELIENLQAELDGMQLPATVRWRIQTAMPTLPPSPSISISCQAPTLSSKFLSSLHSFFSTPGNQDTNANTSHRTIPYARPVSNVSVRNKQSLVAESEIEIDPWTLLEDGTGSITPSNSGSLGGPSSDQSNLKACYWLKGAVRARRTDITYIGSMDEDS